MKILKKFSLKALINHKITSLLFKLLIIYIFIDILIINNNSIIKCISSKAEVKRLKTELARMQKENASLQKENKKLENDPQAIEKIAREKYGMQKSNEKVYRFVTEDEKE